MSIAAAGQCLGDNDKQKVCICLRHMQVFFQIILNRGRLILSMQIWVNKYIFYVPVLFEDSSFIPTKQTLSQKIHSVVTSLVRGWD